MSILKDLRALSRREAGAEDIAEFSRQVALESNDRGAALLMGTNADLALTQAVHLVLRVSDDLKDDLDKPGGPLETFSQRITMGRALKIYGDITEFNLNLLRQIRNAFAHAHVPISFETKEIAAAVSLFKPLPLLPPHNVGADTALVAATSRGRFQHFTEIVAHNLMAWSWITPVARLSDVPPGFDGFIHRKSML